MYSSFNENNIEITRDDINKIINFNPINVYNYQQAFIHKSVLRFLDKKEKVNNSFERYEFLGDAVLNLIVANYLFKNFKDKEEGFLTKIRTRLVNGKTLSFLANKLELNKFLIISQNVEFINGRKNDRILEDVLESLICSIYLDLGFKYAETFYVKLIEKYINFKDLEEDNNYKDILLRYCQSTTQTTPSYKLIKTDGKTQNRIFTSAVIIKDIEYESGIGKTKKISEQEASKNTLIKLGVKFT